MSLTACPVLDRAQFMSSKRFAINSSSINNTSRNTVKICRRSVNGVGKTRRVVAGPSRGNYRSRRGKPPPINNLEIEQYPQHNQDLWRRALVIREPAAQ